MKHVFFLLGLSQSSTPPHTTNMFLLKGLSVIIHSKLHFFFDPIFLYIQRESFNSGFNFNYSSPPFFVSSRVLSEAAYFWKESLFLVIWNFCQSKLIQASVSSKHHEILLFLVFSVFFHFGWQYFILFLL